VPIANNRPLPGISSPHRASMRLMAPSSEYCRRQLKKDARKAGIQYVIAVSLCKNWAFRFPRE
jgi:hypothetical protein